MIDINNLIGVPFSLNGENPKDGFDCYGLVVYVFKTYFNLDIPNYNHQLIDAFNAEDIQKAIKDAFKDWEEIKNPVVPSLILIKNHPLFINHIGVYIGDNKFIHSLDKVGVILSDINDKYWKRRIKGFYKWTK